MPEQYEPRSPEWWRERLNKQLEARRPHIQRYEAYYDGTHRLAFATSKFREAFGVLFSAFADNWCDLVVDASVERLRIDGFRFGDDEKGDTEAWRIWQENQLDADSVLAHTEAVKCGASYLLVSPPESETATPRITVEHPSQVIVEHEPGARRKRVAALKKWLADDDHLMATLYLPDGLYKWRSEAALKSTPTTDSSIRWVPRDDVIDNPLGVVSMVPLYNNPSLLGGGQSDIAKVIPVQDAINKLTTDMIVASEFAAFRQRWATGIENPVDPDTGEPIKLFKAAVDRMFVAAGEDAKFGEFSESSLGNYVSAIEMLIQHVAAQTRTPPHYLLGQSGAFPSGESLKAMETGLVAKVQRKQIAFGEGYEEALRLAFQLMGDETRAQAMNAETIWKDPESRTESQHVDALVKLKDLGVPLEALWEEAGFTPTQIARFKTMKRNEAIEATLLEPFAGSPNGQGAEPEPVEV